jgi:VCBS repeat-containing protein
MSTSSLLQIFQITESQSQKALAVNLAVSQLEQAIADMYEVDTTAADTTGYDLVLDYDDTNDLTSRQALRCIYMVLSADATASFNVIHPQHKHLFFIRNESSYAATVKTDHAGSVGFIVEGGAFLICYCDGTDIIDMSKAFSVPSIIQHESYDVSFYATPVADEVIAKFLVRHDATFMSDFAGSLGIVDTNPAASFVMSVKNGATEIGTITISMGGAYTFTTTASAQINITAGDVLTVNAPAVADTTIKGIVFALNGAMVVDQ